MREFSITCKIKGKKYTFLTLAASTVEAAICQFDGYMLNQADINIDYCKNIKIKLKKVIV